MPVQCSYKDETVTAFSKALLLSILILLQRDKLLTVYHDELFINETLNTDVTPKKVKLSKLGTTSRSSADF